MGTILVGQKKKKTLNMGVFTIAPSATVENKNGKTAEVKKDAREKRLAEIKSLPVDEQLPLLLEEGFIDEAKELSEKLAVEQAGESSGKAEDTTAGEGEGEKTETDDGDGEGETEPEKRKVGRPKKSEE